MSCNNNNNNNNNNTCLPKPLVLPVFQKDMLHGIPPGPQYQTGIVGTFCIHLWNWKPTCCVCRHDSWCFYTSMSKAWCSSWVCSPANFTRLPDSTKAWISSHSSVGQCQLTGNRLHMAYVSVKCTQRMWMLMNQQIESPTDMKAASLRLATAACEAETAS